MVFTSKSNASELKIEGTFDRDEKIMEYDARTGETKEVDIEALEKELEIKGEKVRGKDAILKPKNIYKGPSLRVGRKDSAERITNVKIAPYNRVCRIVSTNSNNKEKVGSAAIVGKRLAITAAHCVWDSSTKQVMKNWKLYPGYAYSNGQATSQATPCGWDKVFYSNGWMTNTNPKNFTEDWAICILQADVGNQVGHFGAQSYGTSSEMINLPVTTFGYPGDVEYGFQDGGKDQYKTGDKITKAESGAFLYNGFCVGGFSGGPIVRDSDNYIVGIHAAGEDAKIGLGVRITQNMINIMINNQ